MKLFRKRVSFKAAAIDAEGALRDLLIEQPKAFFRDARERMRDLPKSNYELACRFAEQGKWFDAVFRFNMTLRWKPDYPNALYNLGGCYLRMGKIAEARATLLKALRQTPNHSEALFMLSTIDPNAVSASQRPTQMPMGMVTGFFTNNADGYDVTEAGNKYQAGKVMHELAKPLLKVATPAIVDLGCGSGIAARPWRGVASRIHGVDVTPAMAQLAQAATHEQKKLYDAVTIADARSLPAEVAAGAADLVLLINVVQFMGDLTGVLKTAYAALGPTGMVLLTAEPTTLTNGYGVVAATGRFGHTPAYVKQTASEVGFTLIKETPVELYAGVPAQAYMFSKGSL
jgi:predicted TPR repeat methyltransferase